MSKIDDLLVIVPSKCFKGIVGQRFFCFLNPFPDIPISFGGIARSACRDDVMGSSFAAFANRHNVIHCLCVVVAVCAFAVKHVKFVFYPYGGNRIGSSFSRVSVLSSFISVICVVSIALAIILVSMWLAHTIAHVFLRQPFAAFTAPLHALLQFLGTFLCAWSSCLSGILAFHAYRGVSITPTAIFTKGGCVLPRFALATSLFAVVDQCKIFIETNANRCRGNLHCANFTAHVTPLCFAFFSVHSILSQES